MRRSSSKLSRSRRPTSGGVRFGRVEQELRDRFRADDPCGLPFDITTDSSSERLLSIRDEPHEVVWTAEEIGGAPYREDFSLSSNQMRVFDLTRFVDNPVPNCVSDVPIEEPRKTSSD